MPGHFVLEDVTIADFTQFMQGGWASQQLGDMGADVIKIEPPRGEPERHARYQGEDVDGVPSGFLAKNRNKRSVAVNLKTDDGQQVARDIVADADVLMENFRPGVMDRFDLGYEDVREFNPDVVYVSGTAYGRTGPYSNRPGQDLLYQAMTGLASYTGREDDPPTPAGTVVVDEHSATLIALHTMYALYHRELTGEGQRVNACLLNSAIHFQCQEITHALSTGNDIPRGRKTHGHPFLTPPYGIYEAIDGYVAIGYSPLERVAEALGASDLATYETEQEQFKHRDELHNAIELHTAERTVEELIADLSAADVQAAPVNDVTDVAEDPQVQHNDILLELEHPSAGTYTTVGFPVEMSKTPGAVRLQPPELGQHTDDVLAECGYSSGEIRALREDGVVR